MKKNNQGEKIRRRREEIVVRKKPQEKNTNNSLAVVVGFLLWRSLSLTAAVGNVEQEEEQRWIMFLPTLFYYTLLCESSSLSSFTTPF
jgi:hypothetical protein